MKNLKKQILIPVLGTAMLTWLPMTVAREVVVLPGVVGPVGVASGVQTQGSGLLTIGNQDINTQNDAGGAITTDAANTANIAFMNSSTVTGFVGTTGSTFLGISAGTGGNTVTFNGPVYSTTFSVAGAGTVNFNGGFTSNTGSTMDFAGDGFINVGAGQTVKAAVTNTAGAGTGTLTLNADSIVDGAVGAASGLKQITVAGGNALITGQAQAATYTLGTNTLNVAGAFAIPTAGTINTTIFSQSLYGKITPVGAASIGNALQVQVTVTGPIPVGSIFNIVDATSGTSGSTVTATSNTTRYRFSAAPTTNGLVQIIATQIPLAEVVATVDNPAAPVLAPVIDALPLTPASAPLLTAITLLPTATQVANGLAQLQPDAVSLASPEASYRATQQLEQVWATHLAATQQACAPGDTRDERRQSRDNDVSPCLSGKRSQLWAAGFGYAGTQRGANGYEGYSNNSAGLLLGYDMPLSPSLTLGGSLRYARSSLDGISMRSNGQVRSRQASVYLGYAPGNWFANADLVYGSDDYMSSRRISFSGVDETAKADYSGHQYTAFGTAGYHYRIGDGATVLTPFATIQHTRMKIDGYTEFGGAATDLRVAARDHHFTQSGLGVKLARDISSSDVLIRPEIHATWLHSFDGQAATSTAAFVSGGPQFNARGVSSGRNLVDVGASLLIAGDNTWSFEAGYDYQHSHRYSAGQVMLKATMRL
jgi:outer membrane autotransporter protein